MATRQVIISDITGKEIADGEHAVVVIEHPNYPIPVEIDVELAEADKMQTTKLDLVHVVINHGGKSRKVVLDARTFDKMVSETVMEGARKATRQEEAKPARKARGTGAPKGDRVDYTAPDKFGQLHRGRITEEEAQLVRANPEQASANRQAQGHPAIDFNDAKEKARYGIQ